MILAKVDRKIPMQISPRRASFALAAHDPSSGFKPQSITKSGESGMIHAIQKHGQKGFTLVEVIVVAVIVAALAGVAVPVYLGYVNSSRLNAATNTAGAVASFMGSCKNATGNVLANYPAQLRAVDDAVVGVATLTCNIPGANDPTVSIPTQIRVQLRNQPADVAGATIRAQHVENAAEWSPEYAY